MGKKSNKRIPTSKVEVDIEHIRRTIVAEIMGKYDMNIKQFCESEHPKRLGINPRPLRNYLSPKSGAICYESFSKLYEHLGLGSLTRKVVVTRKFYYYIEGGI